MPVLAVAAVFIAACGDSGSSTSSATTAAPGTGATATTTAGGTAANTQPIKVGVLLPLSGALAASNNDYKILVDNITKESGHDKIDGRTVQVVLRDTQSNAAGATSATHQLLDQDNVQVVLGPLYTAEAAAVLPLIADKKVLEITFTGCPDCGDGTKNPTTFSIEYDRPVQGPATIDRVKALGKTKFSMIQSDDATGQDYANAVKTAAQAANIQIQDTVKFTPASLDISVQAKQLKDSGADTVYVASAVPADIINILKAFKEINYAPIMLGNAALGNNTIVPAAGPDWVKKFAASGFSPNFLNPTVSAAAMTFRDTFKQVSGTTGATDHNLNQTAVIQDAFDMAKAAIEGTHSTDGPTLQKWLQDHGFKGLRANYTFTASKHNGFSPSDVGWVLPGSFKDGFSDAAPTK